MELVAWLKPYPAHSPIILPPGLVTEDTCMFVRGSKVDKHLMWYSAVRGHANLQRAPAAAARRHGR